MSSICILTAFYNEEGNLPVLRQRLEAVVEDLGVEAEFILIDDHSNDRSPALARQWADEDPRVKYIRLSRNSGSHAAYAAGLKYCTADCAVLLAADLQNPPESISSLLVEWKNGNDVVWAYHERRLGESATTMFFSRAANWLIHRWILPNWPIQGADFVLLDRKVVAAYNSVSEKHTSAMATIVWMGFRQTSVPYVKQPRLSGTSKWTFAKKIKLLVDTTVSFSYLPIRLISALGLFISLLGFLVGGVIAVEAICGQAIAGWAAVMSAVMVIGGLQMLTLGVLGEYVWRTYDEARGRPSYFIQELYTSAGFARARTPIVRQSERHAVASQGGIT